MKTDTHFPIDIVVMWVDGSDPAWQKERDFYAFSEGAPGIDLRDCRYRDYGLLKYVFRGIERNMPWANKVFFVTNGQRPAWLNLDHERLVWVKHEDFIPAEYLPTFSANPVEMNFHRIEDLSERFVFFNDDMFVLNPVPESLFFRDGMPVANPRAGLSVPGTYDTFAHIPLNDIMLINKNFAMRSVIFKNPGNWFVPWRVGLKTVLRNLTLLPLKRFVGLSNPHTQSALLKSTIREVWECEPEVLHRTSSNKFRSFEDVNQYLLYEWQIAKGIVKPERMEKLGHYYGCYLDNYAEIAREVEQRKHSLICINDQIEEASEEELNDVRVVLGAAFEAIFPEKSSFEL